MAIRQRLLAITGILGALALVACSSGGDAGSPPPVPPPPAPPPANTAPVAAFTGATSVIAGTPLPLDASTSTDADNDALTYTWNFGNGQRGGGQRIAALFDAEGSFTVALTVDDARGGSNTTQRVVTVSAGPTGAGPVDTLTIVRDTAGVLLANVTVTVVATGGATADTGSDGRATLATERGIPVTLKFSKVGYADQFKTLTLPVAAESGYLTATMLAREAALTLASAAAGGTLTGKDGAKVTFAPNSLVDANGVAVTGPVQVSMTPVNVATSERAFPGRFEGVRANGDQGIIVSNGTVEFALSAGGAPVQLAPGKKASVELPNYIQSNLDGNALLAGASVPIWSLNERTGQWVEEGAGTVIAGNTPSDLALRAEVTHFTWWNIDHFVDPPGRPKPKCRADTNHDGIYEDLTGTGYCWTEATISPTQSNSSAKILPPDVRAKQLLAEPVTQRLPTYAATQSIPTTGGVILPIPPGVDVLFRAFAHNGSWMGQRIVNVAAGAEDEYPILLEPVQDAAGSVRLTPPADAVYASFVAGEVDTFVFAATANTTYQVIVSDPPSSLLGGSVLVATAANASLASGNFGTDPFNGTVTPAASGDLTITVTSNGNSPGAYRIEVRAVASSTCGTPATMAVPSTTASLPLPANSVTCFNLTLAADAVLQVENVQLSSLSGAVSLIAPNGEQLALDAYAGNGQQVQLYAAVAQAGTYRLQFTNTGNTAGAITGLSTSLITVDGTLAVPGAASFAGPSNLKTSYWYLVKPAVAGSEFAVLFNANGINQNFRVHPFFTQVANTGETALVTRKSLQVVPLIQVRRSVGNTAWNFNLETRVPLPLALNTDVLFPDPGSDALFVYRFDAVAAELLRLGVSRDSNLSLSPSVELPTAALAANPTNSARIFTVQSEGVQTLLARKSAGNGAFTFRVNTLAPIEPIVLTDVNVLPSTLALGEVKRYRFDVTQGQIFAMELSSSSTTEVQAQIEGFAVTGNIHMDGLNASSPPRVVGGHPFIASGTASADLLVFSPGRYTEDASGPLTVRLFRPTPAPTALGSLIATTLVMNQPQTFSYNIPAAGRHLLCVKDVNSTSSMVEARVWGPAPNTANGDLGDWAAGAFQEYLGSLRAGANTLSLSAYRDATTAVDTRLVPLVAPTALTLGAAASNGTLTACERDYFSFAGTAGQTYTVRVTATFVGEVRVRKLVFGDDYTQRLGSVNFEDNLGSTPLPLVANTERVITFTIPSTVPFGSGTYIVEVDGTNEAAGTYTVTATSP